MKSILYFLSVVVFSFNAYSQAPAPSEQVAPPAVEAAPAPTPTPPPLAPAAPPVEATKQIESGLLLGGLLYVGLQNWSRVGATGDSKMGFGFGGDFLIGTNIDDLKVGVGPHFSFNQWSEDYRNKPNSITDRVYVNMNDVGLNFFMDFGDMLFHIGGGTSTITSAMEVGGVEIKYAYSGQEYGYKSFGIGLKSGAAFFGLSGVQYDGFAKYADRVEFNLGWAFF